MLVMFQNPTTFFIGLFLSLAQQNDVKFSPNGLSSLTSQMFEIFEASYVTDQMNVLFQYKTLGMAHV